MEKHTEGPWEVGNLIKNDFEVRYVEIKGADGLKRIAKATYGQTDEECAANAHLIAAAPELLEALKGIIAWTNNTAMYHLKDEDLLPKGFEKWESLITKAEGGV